MRLYYSQLIRSPTAAFCKAVDERTRDIDDLVVNAPGRSDPICIAQPCTLLHCAVLRRDIVAVQHVLNCGADPNAHSEKMNFFTAFQLAALLFREAAALMRGKFEEELERQLYEGKCTLNHAGYCGVGYGLHYAAAGGHLEVLQQLKGQEGLSPLGLTELHCAAANGQYDIVDWLCSNNRVVLLDQDDGGKSALLWAAWGGNVSLVKLILAQLGTLGDYSSVEVDAQGNTALLVAANGGHFDVVCHLASTVPELRGMRNHTGNTPCMSAAAHGRLEVMQYLWCPGEATKANRMGRTALLTSAQYGHQNVVEWLMDERGSKAVAEEEDYEGSTVPLHAAEYGHLPLLKWCNKQEVWRKGFGHTHLWRTAVLQAASGGEIEMMNWLLANNLGSLTEVDKKACNALACAAGRGRLPMVKYLVEEKDLKVDYCDRIQQTALMRAARAGHVSVCGYLVSQGASLSKEDAVGNTALHIATSATKTDVVALLIRHSTKHELLKENWHGYAPVMVAASAGDVESLKLFTCCLSGQDLTKMDLAAVADGYSQHEAVGWLLSAGLGDPFKCTPKRLALAERQCLVAPWIAASHTLFPPQFRALVEMVFWARDKGALPLFNELLVLTFKFLPSTITCTEQQTGEGYLPWNLQAQFTG